MMLTVQDLLELQEVREYSLLTKGLELDQIVIESVSILSPPAENWARKNELVISMAISNPSKLPAFRLFVQDIVNAGASVLVVTFEGNRIVDIPESIITYMEEAGVPLIVIPWEYRFSEIMEAVLDRVRYRDSKTIQQFKNLQKDILLFYLQGKTLSNAANFITGLIEVDIFVVDMEYKLIASSIPYSQDTVSEKSLIGYTQRLELSAGGSTYGYLIVKPRNENEPLLFSKELFEQYIIPSLALWFNKEQLVNDTRLTLINDFVWSLANGDWNSWDTMLYRARLFSFNLNSPYVCIVGRPSISQNSHQSGITNWDKWTEKYFNTLLNIILSTAKLLGHKVMATSHEDTLIIFIAISRNDFDPSVHQYLDHMEKMIQAEIPQVIYSWGISEISLEEMDFRKRYADAKFALDICDNERRPNRRNTYHGINLYRMLSAVSDNPDIARIVSKTLSKLKQYDNEKDLSLIDTFNAYIQNGYNVSKTAKAMHLHRQSLIYRLNKIMELSDCDLQNAEHRFLLELCTRIQLTCPPIK